MSYLTLVANLSNSFKYKSILSLPSLKDDSLGNLAFISELFAAGAVLLSAIILANSICFSANSILKRACFSFCANSLFHSLISVP